MHFADDIAAADEFSVDKDLGKGRPIGEFFDALTEIFIREDVEVFDRGSIRLQDLHCASGKAAHGLVLGALHIDHDFVGFDRLFNIRAHLIS